MRNQFLTNYTEVTFLDKIKDNLRRCKSFAFSVSFIKKAGLVLLFKDVEAAIERGAQGRIITSTYQNFTDIESIKSFFALQCKHSNFECHLDYECFHDNHYSTLGYHSKGYLFEFDDCYEVIIGSSNITRYALLKNIEWDVVVRESEPEVYNQACAEFDDKWEATHLLNSEIINLYSNKLNFAIERWDMDYDLTASNIKPNFMQRKALKELNRYRAVGTSRALVVAAAGSGKTYLAAFDALNFNPKRLLYIVHEGSILKKSLETFSDVFGNSVTYGIFSGEHKEMDADFVFATNITMCKSLELFAKNEFDYIIIDECHHATAETYKRIIGYFEPEFLLGLTATPERMDNQDVFDLFDKNVPYELRLRDAIINELVVPFKYYGIRDQLVDYGLSKSEERKMIAQLANDEHIEFISAQIESHRGQGKLKALAFCRNVTHARMMCEAMGERYKTAYLTGRNDIGERIRAYNDLQSDEADLEILFTVDILNEGVDIPGVNMVLFLRPTESSTIFIQQLGRGLRKYDNKPYVTVLDFIGNSYKRSVQIAFALGSLSRNLILEKKLMQQLVRDDFEALGLREYGVEINVDDTHKLSKANITYRIDAIEDEVQQEPATPPTTPPPPIRSKVFWVFQNQTYDEESYNGYIFAGFYGPHHWERLKEVRCGDIIIHSFRAEIVAVSIAKDVAYSWRRYDGIQGRRIDCDYYRLRRCISTSARKTKNIELCGGSMYQPFNTNGTGNQGYLYDMTFKLRDYYISEIVKYNPYILDKIPELRKYNTL